MASKLDDKQIEVIGNLLNDKNRPLKERFRALFTLKNLGGPVAIEAISKCFVDDSALLKHELAYCLGQMQDVAAIPHLVKVIEDVAQEPMVRHEAGKLPFLSLSVESFDLMCNSICRRGAWCHRTPGCCTSFRKIS